MTKTEKTKKDVLNLNLEEMAQAGLHMGHRTSRIHPKMGLYLQGTRNTIHIINLEKTAEKLKEALDFIKEIISEGKILLLVGTKIQHKNLVKETAQELNLPYVSERWLGGTITNFDIIRKRIEYFKNLEKEKTEGGLEKYTKKERAKFDHEIRTLETKFGGIKNLEKLPDALFVLSVREEDLAIKEAKMKGIKIIGVSDTNADPSLVDYPIPANDDAISSVRYILDKLKEVAVKVKPKIKE